MMKREFRDQWVAKLRSGEVGQATGVLCALNDYRCCLGVAFMIDDCGADIDNDSGYTEDEIQELNESVLSTIEGKWFDGSAEFPDPNHLNHWGLDRNVAFRLAAMNDGGSYQDPVTNERSYLDEHSFNEIADWIEKNIPVSE